MIKYYFIKLMLFYFFMVQLFVCFVQACVDSTMVGI